MFSALGMTFAFITFFIVVFAAFFVWNRIAVAPEESAVGWKLSLLGSVLACALFAVCFAIGVWFSIARLKGDGWILSA